MNETEITVIIPTLNEESALAQTLEKLSMQRRVSMEIIVADGGSTDATLRIARETLRTTAVIVTPAGRSSQMNAGVSRAKGEYLLFLHADSWFDDPMALRKGIDQLRDAAGQNPPTLMGGHFSLIFARSDTSPSHGYTFYQRKSRLNRHGCSHGDQGFLLPRTLFNLAGPYSEQCDLLAQTRFADCLRGAGQWILLSPGIFTSARRFETEGLLRRQTLNAIIMACGAAGRDDFIAKLPGIYRQQKESGRISLQPCLRQLHALIAELPDRERRALWESIGKYVVENAWQVPLFLDVLAGFLLRGEKWGGNTPLLRLFDRYLYRFIDNGGGRKCAELLVRGWLSLMLLPHSHLSRKS